MMEQLKAEALALEPVLRGLFETIHQTPELGRGERHTAGLIRRRLEELGLEVTALADTGTVGPPPIGRRRGCPMPPGCRV